MIKSALLVILLLVTVYSRFLNLNWDSGWGFHPDENNLWGASRNVKLFSKLDPEFYAYGGWPIYLYSFFDTKFQARAFSAFLQTAIVVLLYLTARRLTNSRGGIITASIGVFSAGLVQAAHFLTVESLLGFFGLAILFCLLKHSANDKGKNIWLLLAGVALGLGVGTKVSFMVFALPIFAILLRPGLWKPKAGPLLALLIAVFIFLLTNPFLLDNWKSAWGTLKYESNVAMENLPVFYTRQFIGTIPGWFQAVHIFPYITGWLFLPMFLIGMFVIYFKDTPCGAARSILFAICISALLSFLPLWAKWTRYVVQVLPILILTAGIGVDWVWKKGKAGKAIAILTIISFLPQFFSIIKVYASVDTRVAAADWARLASRSGQAETNIPAGAKIFTEGMDLGIIPFNPVHGENITLFNFYELDEDKSPVSQRKLDALVRESDYFISVSQRVYGNSLSQPEKFQRSAAFYQRLFSGSLGYEKIAEYSADRQFCILHFAFCIPKVSYEETFGVFDHPTVMIFKKALKH